MQASTSSYNIDEITCKYIKGAIEIIVPYINVIIDTFIVNGTFPNQWKATIVVSLLKKGDKVKPSNFRPIFQLSVLFNGIMDNGIMENVVTTQLIMYLVKNNIFFQDPFDFRLGQNTKNAVNKILNLIYSAA